MDDEDIYDILKNNKLIKNEKQYKEDIKKRKENIKRKKLFNKFTKDDDEIIDSEKFTLTDQKNLIIDNLVENKIDLTHIFYLQAKFKKELSEYKYINSNSINELKIGHLVRYVNLNDELKWGGILVKIFNREKVTECTLKLRNKDGNFWDIKFINFYIFFKYRNSKTENFQKLFMSMFNKD